MAIPTPGVAPTTPPAPPASLAGLQPPPPPPTIGQAPSLAAGTIPAAPQTPPLDLGLPPLQMPPAAPAAPSIQQDTPPAAQAMTTAPPATLPTTQPSTTELMLQMGNLGAMAQALGFEGLDFNQYGILPMVRLKGRDFEMGSDVLGNEFLCKISGSRRKHLYSFKRTGPDAKEGESNVLYSYDKVTSASGTMTVEEFLAWGARENQQVSCKPYQEVSATLMDGRPVLLSIPETGSGTALPAFIVKCVSQGLRPDQVIARVYAGPRIDDVKFPYYPWAIDIYSQA